MTKVTKKSINELYKKTMTKQWLAEIRKNKLLLKKEKSEYNKSYTSKKAKKRWRENNKKKVNQASKDYYYENKEKILNRRKELCHEKNK